MAKLKLTSQQGFICRKDRKVIDRRMVVVGNPQVDPASLPDHGPYATNTEGWKESITLTFCELGGGEMYEWTSDTKGGLEAGYGLLNAGFKRIQQAAAALGVAVEDLPSDEVPDLCVVFTLGYGSYANRKFGGTTIYPILAIKGWQKTMPADIDIDDGADDAAAVEDDDEGEGDGAPIAAT